MRSVQSVRWVVAAAVAEALIGLLALRLACLSAMGVLGFVGLIVAAFVVMSWYCGLGLEYRFEVTALFLGWLALMISGVLLAFVFRRDPLQTRATDHEGEEGERQSHRQETDKHKQRLLPLSRLLETSLRAGVWPDSVQVLGGTLASRLPARSRSGGRGHLSPRLPRIRT